MKGPYADRYCADGVISSGWRVVRKAGRIKFGGAWYEADSLCGLTGELVLVQMGEYWGSYVLVFRGAVGCIGYHCRATPT
jgi:hypothetical protein